MALLCFLTSGCLGIADNATAVTDFDLQRYLGDWYEIARLDHRFERGLSNVQANYSLKDDGGVRVINRGFNEKRNEWLTAEGKAYFIGETDVGRLKVSFFGPFYGAYNIIELDKDNYSYAMVVGPDTSHLWILARSPNLDQTIVDRLVSKAEALEIPVNELIFVKHDGTNN